MRTATLLFSLLLTLSATVLAENEPLTEVRGPTGLFSFPLPAGWGVTAEKVSHRENVSQIQFAPDTTLIIVTQATRETDLEAATDRLLKGEQAREIFRALIERRKSTVAGHPATRLRALYQVEGKSVLTDSAVVIADGTFYYLIIERPAGPNADDAAAMFEKILTSIKLAAAEAPPAPPKKLDWYRHPAGALSFKVPEAWDLDTSEVAVAGEVTTLAIRPDCSLVMTVRKKTGTDSGAMAVASVARQKAEPGFKGVLSSTAIKVADRAAVRVHLLRGTDQGDVYSDQVFLVTDTHEIVLRFDRGLGAGSQALAGTFEEVVKGLRTTGDVPAPEPVAPQPPKPVPPKPEPVRPEPPKPQEPAVVLERYVDPLEAYEILLPKDWNVSTVANTRMISPKVGPADVGFVVVRDPRNPYFDFNTWRDGLLANHKRTVLSWKEKSRKNVQVGARPGLHLTVAATSAAGAALIEYVFVETESYYMMLQTFVNPDTLAKNKELVENVRASFKVTD